MSTPAPVADEIYELELCPARRGRVRRVLGGILDALLSVDAGPLELASVGDVVVRRRDDGLEVLRVAAGPPEEAAATLAEVEEQLRTLTPAEFRHRWGFAG